MGGGGGGSGARFFLIIRILQKQFFPLLSYRTLSRVPRRGRAAQIGWATVLAGRSGEPDELVLVPYDTGTVLVL